MLIPYSVSNEALERATQISLSANQLVNMSVDKPSIQGDFRVDCAESNAAGGTV
jgi:hypothetical protein